MNEALYEELKKVCENLKRKYGKSICGEICLRKLSKHCPKSKDEMKKIEGIGNDFIEKYGSDFIETIVNYEKNNTIDNKEKEILSKLENRLVNINQKNRLLYSGKINKDCGIDIFKILDEDNLKNFQEYIFSQESKEFKILDIENFDDSKLKSLLKLMRCVSKIQVESGNDELYVAYPFVQGKMENGDFNVKAPLMLFPVKLDRNNGSFVIKNDDSRDIIYNTTLILANNKFNGKNEVLPDNVVENFNSDNFIENMLEFYRENNFVVKYDNCELEKFFENTKKEFPEYNKGDLQIKKYMVLGLYSTYVTSMYADFHEMIEKCDSTELIKKLFFGIRDFNENTDSCYEDTSLHIEQTEDFENLIKYINELDFSQENVLKAINDTNSLVVQGPPGTGKSQTITSIIAQSVLQNKNVLMVSEKKTALDVIYSRLGELSKFSLLIDDIENKSEFYQQLRAIIDVFNENNYSLSDVDYINEIEEKVKNINDNINFLKEIENKIYEEKAQFGTSMYNLYKVCRKIDSDVQEERELYKFLKDNMFQELLSIKYSELTIIKNKLKEYSNSIKSYLGFVEKNPLIKDIKINLNEHEIFQLREELGKLQNIMIQSKDLPFYKSFKKLFVKLQITKNFNNIIEEYFNINSNFSVENLFNSIEEIKEFLNNYKDFVSCKFIFDKLDDIEKKYVELITLVKNKFKISYEEANDEIYNYILFEFIDSFEKNNINVMNYISHFDSIRNDINKNIIEKKKLTKELVDVQLLKNIKQLSKNNNLRKIEEKCDRKRKMPINKFMNNYTDEMLSSVKIWLMTPEVVSDILPFEKNIFDLVIFDEASQLYVERSIPAIYRAKKVIVAGDQKQLRPSSLGMGRILNEDDDSDYLEGDSGLLGCESLLEAARYKFKYTMLNYHYRSKYNELIAFSNYAFYNGKLMVVSNAKLNSEKPIERIKVENGRLINKENREEAQEVVNLLKQILSKRENNETIGVITFNSSQMNLIEDLIEKAKNDDSNFATLMNIEANRKQNGEDVSFFVKNIERVQGDERDIIIFCIGYAKNQQGRVSINFGWLNQDGGENRLNVAISRAKSKIYVVTSIEPDELLVDYSKNRGPKLFKEYLKYVKAVDEKNTELQNSILLSLLDSNYNDGKQLSFDSAFEEEVYSKLVEQGYEVETQYGVGGYKIDLVIKSKDCSQNMLGIECDGRLYHSSKFARERDYHRQKYLETRGWKIYRIWSTNWWRNPELEIEKIKRYINNLDK